MCRRRLAFAHNHAGMGDPALVGREMELAELEAGLRRAVEHGGAFLITGPPGIGKTSLEGLVGSRRVGRELELSQLARWGRWRRV